MMGYIPVGIEFGAELTYPEPEGTSASILNASAQLVAATLTTIYGIFFKRFGDFTINCISSGLLLIGIWMTYIIPNDLRRQKAELQFNKELIKLQNNIDGS